MYFCNDKFLLIIFFFFMNIRICKGCKVYIIKIKSIHIT